MSEILILNESEVRALLPMESCIAVMEDALKALARGEVYNPLRQIIRTPVAAGLLGLMPAFRALPRPLFGLKEVCVFPGNPARGLDTHLGAVLLHSGETGELLGLMNASAITEIRTAAVSAVATRLLANEDAEVLAIVGAGVQASSHIAAMQHVRRIRELRIVSRTAGKAAALASEFQSSFPKVVTAESVEECLQGADIVVTATSSRDPVLRRSWLRAGTHINAVGSSIRAAREIDGATMLASRLFVDRRESTLNESGDFISAMEEGLIGPDHIVAEIGELLTGAAAGRRAKDEITLFKSLGLAIEDLAAAEFLYGEAAKSGLGTRVDF